METDDDIHRELEDFLGAAAPGGVSPHAEKDESSQEGWRVECLLKESPYERTELVWMRRADGSETGPYVRKTFSAAEGAASAPDAPATPGLAAPATPGAAYRLLLDAQLAGRRFLHLPRIFSCDEGPGSRVVIMEYVQGKTLRDWVQALAPAERPALAQTVFPQLCDALTELNEGLGLPLVHRDVTPANVILTG